MIKQKKLYWRLFSICISVAAYGYLGYKLLTFDGYASMAESFINAGWLQYGAIGLAILLFPFNIFLEALKWQYMLMPIEQMTIAQAQAQTYFGFVGAFLTPSRLGDYPARVTMLQNKSEWLTAIALGGVGSMALVLITYLLGIPAMIIFFGQNIDTGLSQTTLIYAAVIIALSMLIIGLSMPQWAGWIYKKASQKSVDGKTAQLLLQLSRVSIKRFLVACSLSLLRYLTYSIQLWLVLIFCGINLSIAQAAVAIPAYYLLATIIPSVPMADAAIRGGISILVFGAITTNEAGIAISAIMLWVINTILPMLVGTIVSHRSGKGDVGR